MVSSGSSDCCQRRNFSSSPQAVSLWSRTHPSSPAGLRGDGAARRRAPRPVLLPGQLPTMSACCAQVFGTKNQLTFVISGTGSAGMETAITNFVDAGTKVAVLANGYFCDRMTEMAKRQGANVVRLEKPWGEFFTADEATEFIRREKPQVVMYVMAETSTGVFERGEAICKAAHEVGAIVIADCVTSLGAMPVEVDKTGIDVAYSCTQKGLSCPPGPVADHGLAARRRIAEAAQVSSSHLVLRYRPHRRLPARVASLSPHRVGNHVLCAARRPDADRRRRPGAALRIGITRRIGSS